MSVRIAETVNGKEMPSTANGCHRRCEELLGWKEGESDRFSLGTLKAFVRGRDPDFDWWLEEFMRQGRHLFL